MRETAADIYLRSARGADFVRRLGTIDGEQQPCDRQCRECGHFGIERHAFHMGILSLILKIALPDFYFVLVIIPANPPAGANESTGLD